MRDTLDPGRIGQTIVSAQHATNQRLGQLLWNVQAAARETEGAGSDIFYMSDEDVLEMIRTYGEAKIPS